MLSWKLWRALNHPPALHPLFWRTIRRHAPLANPNSLTTLDRLVLIYLTGFIGLFFLSVFMDSSGALSVLSIAVGCLAVPIVGLILILLRNTLFSGFFCV